MVVVVLPSGLVTVVSLSISLVEEVLPAEADPLAELVSAVDVLSVVAVVSAYAVLVAAEDALSVKAVNSSWLTEPSPSVSIDA